MARKKVAEGAGQPGQPSGSGGVVSVAVLARVFDCTPRRIQQLRELGMPAVGRGEYPLLPCVQWYIKWLRNQAEARGRANAEDPIRRAELREKVAAAQLKEIEVAKRLEQLVSIDDMVVMVREPLDRVNAQLLRAPTRYAPACVGLTTIEEALKVWQDAIDEIREELRTMSTEPRKRVRKHVDQDAVGA